MRAEYYERGRFWVDSESEAGVRYLVDLLEYNRAGRCDCTSFRVNIQTKYDHQMKPDEGQTECKHLKFCRSLIPDVDAVLFRMAVFERKCRDNPEKFGGRHG